MMYNKKYECIREISFGHSVAYFILQYFHSDNIKYLTPAATHQHTASFFLAWAKIFHHHQHTPHFF